MPIRFIVTSLILALTAFGLACRDEGTAERAREAVDEAPREAAEILEQEGRGLIDAAEKGGAARTAEAVEGAAREVADTVETPGGAKAVAEQLSENVEDSARVYDETYDAARKRGEDAIEASGEAYNAVLDVPEEKDKEKESR